MSVVFTICVKTGAQLPFATPPHAMVVLKDGVHAAAAPSHLFRSRGGPRESLEPGHEFGLARDDVRGRRTMFSASVCAFAESADAQPRALAAAAAVRVPMLFPGSVAVGHPAPPQCDPFHRRNRPSGRVSGPFRIPSLDPLWSGKRRIVRKRDQRVVPTKKGRRTAIAGALQTRRAKLG